MAECAHSTFASEDTLASQISDMEDDLIDAEHLTRLIALAGSGLADPFGETFAHVAWKANAAVDRLKARWRELHELAVREGGAA